MKSLIKLCSLLLFLHCLSTNKPEAPEENLPCPIPIQIGKIYGSSGSPELVAEVLPLVQELVQSICLGNLRVLPNLLEPDMGLFLEGKAHWTTREVVQDLANPKGYFETTFFQKGNKVSMTVQETLHQSRGLEVDFFFDSHQDCELKLHFLQNKKLARNLINPRLSKFQGRWYLVGML